MANELYLHSGILLLNRRQGPPFSSLLQQVTQPLMVETPSPLSSPVSNPWFVPAPDSWL